MLTSMRPLLHGSSSGSICNTAQSSAGGPTKRPFVLSSTSTPSTSCPTRNGSTRAYEAHTKPLRNATSACSASAVESNSSTLAGTAVLAAQGLVHSYNGTAMPTQAIDMPGSAAAPCVQEPLLGWDHGEPPLAHALDAAALRAADAASSASQLSFSQHTPNSDGRPGAAHTNASESASHAEHARPRRSEGDQHQPIASTSASATSSNRSQRGRNHDANSAPPASGKAASPFAAPNGAPRLRPVRPRLNPPPPPLSWSDYPYSRRPAASVCQPTDAASLKLEALFQSVLHYPRVPPKLLRFLRRAAPGGVEGQLPYVTATVECMSVVLGREVAVYLIRRRPWVVLVPADCIGPRMDAVRRLLCLPPSSVLDVLRKNPNLLRMERTTLRMRYEALHDSTGFSTDQVRALVLKYPLILNFQPDSVDSAATALRRLCSARPSWASHHSILSPSQFAFYMRDRVHTLLRLEYLLITGAGDSWTVRDIIKTSNNMFKKTYSGFRSWMTDRLRRLRQRLARARAQAAQAEAEGRPLAPEALTQVAEETEDEYQESEQRRLQRNYGKRRQLDREDAERRAEQRRLAIEAKVQLQQEQERLQYEQERQQRRLEQGSHDDEEEEEAEEAGMQRRLRSGMEWMGDADADGDWAVRQRRASGSGAGASGRTAAAGRLRDVGSRGGQKPPPAAPPASSAAAPAAAWSHAAGVAGPGRERSPPPPARRGDLLASVSPGQVWRRPGTKVPLPQGESSPQQHQQQDQQWQQHQQQQYQEQQYQEQQQQWQQQQPQEWQRDGAEGERDEAYEGRSRRQQRQDTDESRGGRRR